MNLKHLFCSLTLLAASSFSAAAQSYEWRGCMLDVSRHFFDANFIKRQIDVLSSKKINKLHLHLTDAGGWRMQIKKYPLLTQKTAWRTQSDWEKWWNLGDRTYLSEDTPNAYGGYYTQDELREIVAYAKSKNIDVVPEIEMPGHSEEVMEAYPELKCVGHQGQQADMCPSNPATYTFLQNVLGEVLDIFPSAYIHLGGDEAGKAAWKDCSRCQDMVKRLHLSSYEQLQDVFMHRMTRYVSSLGRNPIVWDEALTDSLAPNTTIMVWRNADTAQEAMDKGYAAILTPTSHCYLDYYQDAPSFEPRAIGGFLPFDTVYNFKPIKGVLGVQGNLWTEYVPTEQHAEYMLYPRMFALATIGWDGDNRPSLKEARKQAIAWCDSLRKEGITTFDLKKEHGQRREFYKHLKHKALHAKVIYNKPYSPYYVASGATTLTDGLQGSWKHGDKRWQGFIGDSCLDVTIDLGAIKSFKKIYANFMQSDGAWIYFPHTLSISISKDGQTYQSLYHKEFPTEALDVVEFRAIGWNGKDKARYIRLQGTTAKRGDWIFLDEIVVK